MNGLNEAMKIVNELWDNEITKRDESLMMFATAEGVEEIKERNIKFKIENQKFWEKMYKLKRILENETEEIDYSEINNIEM